jgi:hypothetical protein
MLNYLDNKFINSSLKTKIELYLLPLFFIYLSYFISQTSINDNPVIQSKVNLDYSKIEFKDSFLGIFSNLEDYALKNQIEIFSITNNKKIITIKAKAQMENIEKFIKKIENLNNFTNIKILLLNKKELDNYFVELQVDLNKFYIKKVEKEVDKNSSNINNKDYKIKGIISEYAFINDIWLKKDENIDDLKLTKIEKDFVVLENENKKIVLELSHEYNP